MNLYLKYLTVVESRVFIFGFSWKRNHMSLLSLFNYAVFVASSSHSLARDLAMGIWVDMFNLLTSMAHKCADKRTFTGSSNGFSPAWHQAITGSNGIVLMIEGLETSEKNKYPQHMPYCGARYTAWCVWSIYKYVGQKKHIYCCILCMTLHWPIKHVNQYLFGIVVFMMGASWSTISPNTST